MSLSIAPRPAPLPSLRPSGQAVRGERAAQVPGFLPLDLSVFEGGPVSKAPTAATAPTAPTAPMAGAWRGGPDTEIGKAISTMLERLRQCPIQLKGQTAEEVFSNALLDNRRVSNEQLLQMTQVKLEDLADSPKAKAQVLKKIPDARQRDSHQFTVAMLAAATGIDPQKLSEATPSLGMTGAPGTPLLYAPSGEKMKRSTALHDFTDYLRGAGIEGLNRAVWGVENRILSAIKSVIGRWKY